MSDFVRLVNALKELAPFDVITGDAVQRTNPHARQMVNSTITWAVSSGDRSAHKMRECIETIHEIITKGVTK